MAVMAGTGFTTVRTAGLETPPSGARIGNHNLPGPGLGQETLAEEYTQMMIIDKGYWEGTSKEG